VAVLNVFLPALAFNLMSTSKADRSFVSIPLTAAVVVLLCTVVGFAVYSLIPRIRDISRPTFGVILLAASYGNVTYLGLPVITEMLGPDQGYVAILYDLLASTPLLLTVGVFLASRYGSGRSATLGASLRRVFMLPPLWGVAVGIAARLGGIPVPQLVLDTTALMGKAVIPLMMFTVGLALDFRELKRLPLAVPAIMIKLILAPFLAWWVGARLGVSGIALKAITIEGAMPVMILALVIADEFDLDVPFAATCIAISTVALFFTLPVMMSALT